MVIQSLVVASRSFVDISSYVQTMEEMNHEGLGVAIRVSISRFISLEATMAHISKAEVCRVGMLCISLINTRVSLVGLSMSYFRLPMWDNPTILITLVRSVVKL